MKKQRGLRRYYRNLSKQNDFDKATWLNFSIPDTWFDNWHLHFDWKGLGNNSFKRRKPHLDKLFRHFELLAEKTKDLMLDFQLYAILFDHDSSNDALFLHTPNPNGNAFPNKLQGLSLKSNLTNNDLEKYIKSLTGFKCLYGKAEENFCLLYKEHVGQSLL
jgi:hypothetical protein